MQHAKIGVHLIVFLALLIAWVITRESWLIGMILGVAVGLGVERSPVGRR